MRKQLAILAFALLLVPWAARAHCDGLDGPVVRAARRALETGDANHALMWVHNEQEPELRAAFTRTLDVRKRGGDAATLADTWFFETLVRLHRAGEGAPYTGLKPAGRDLGPAIPAADRALETGSAEPLLKLVTETARNGVEARFRRALAASKTPDREYVRAYVEFLHYVEKLHEAGIGGAPEAHEH